MATTPLVTIDTQHDEMIHDAQLDYYAKNLATASSDRTVKVFEVSGDTYNKRVELKGHEGPVWQVAWAHPKFGVLLASCCYAGTITIHRESPPSVWTPIYTHNLKDASVNSIAWAPHELGLMLACAPSDGKVVILSHRDDDTWVPSSLQDSKLGCNAISWGPFNSVGSRNESGTQFMRLVTGSCDKHVRFWRCPVDGDTWEEERHSQENPPHSDWVRDVAWAPSTGMPWNMVASCSEDGRVVIWTQSQPLGSWSAVQMNLFSAPVWRVSWSVTGNVLAVSSGDNDVSLWKQSLEDKWELISTVEDAGPAQLPQN
ncbi:unnamed protein product [Choristocarpus tenellus]